MCAILREVEITSPCAPEASLNAERSGDNGYEEFVMSSLRRALGVEARAWMQRPEGLALDAGGSLPLVPGVVWCNESGTPVLVVDVRDGSTTLGEVRDAQRVVSYCLALGLKRGVLVRDRAIRTSHVIPAVGVEEFVEPLASTGPPSEVAAEVRDLAERLRQMAKMAG